jgi:hypothetical protein
MRVAVGAGPGAVGSGILEEGMGRDEASTDEGNVRRPRLARRRLRFGLLIIFIIGLGYYHVFVDAPAVRLHVSHDDFARTARLSKVVYELHELNENSQRMFRSVVFLDEKSADGAPSATRALPPRVEMPVVKLKRGDYELRARFFREGVPEAGALEQRVQVPVDGEEDVLVFVPWPGG